MASETSETTPSSDSHPTTPTARVPSLRSISDSAAAAPPPNPLSTVTAARRGPTTSSTPFAAGGGSLPADIQARIQAFQASRMGTPKVNMGPPPAGMVSPVGPGGPRFGPSGAGGRPMITQNRNSAPVISGGRPPKPSLAQRRMGAFPTGLPAAGGLPPTLPASTDAPVKKTRPHPGSLNSSGSNPASGQGSMFDKYSQYVDAETGSLKFAGKAVLHGKGVEFSSGSSFRMSLSEVQTIDELGKGNYGTVYKVIHRPPTNNISPPSSTSSGDPTPDELLDSDRSPLSRISSNTAGTVMAMKEIRLELDENKFAQIIMELDVLHRCRSPFIINFFGAFFQEGAVYICMEHMDGGSIDKLYYGGVPEPVLRKIAFATVMGLKMLKEEHNIIHRDVKPTNILMNSKGEIKLCDFGVSGNLVASIAKTNIGCQSYMAPERIASGGIAGAVGTGPQGTYGVQSDIWSLGLSLLECAMGCYPYPPETYNNIFSQLSAIVDGEPPDLPESSFSPEARNFVRGCLHKIPKLRPTYAMLLQHPWISGLLKPSVIVEEAEDSDAETVVGDAREDEDGDRVVREWVVRAIAARTKRMQDGVVGPEKPALHAAPLDAVSPLPNRKIDEIVVGMTGIKTG